MARDFGLTLTAFQLGYRGRQTSMQRNAINGSSSTGGLSERRAMPNHTADVQAVPQPDAHRARDQDLQTSEGFSFLIWREIYRVIVLHEREALERAMVTQFDIEVKQCHAHSESELIIKCRFVCEPGKRPKLMTMNTSR